MELLTISQVTKGYEVTPRMLRYYEKMGLLRSVHVENYAYRCYDEEAIKRLQMIILLRKLRIPVKGIAVILEDKGEHAVNILRENITELDGQIKSLETVRKVLMEFVRRLENNSGKNPIDGLGDSELMEAAKGLVLSKSNLKENFGMSELNKANENLAKELPVRIVLLPPFTVASNHVIGEEPEESVGDLVDKFIKDKRLYEKKPDSRYFGFNHPNPGILEGGIHGYEVWVTIPEDMDVPEPMKKKHFNGGLFAALTIKFPEFQYWGELEKWVKNSSDYELNYDPQGLEIMGGCLEEHLNWVYSSHMGWPKNGIDGQLDLLMPIKKKGLDI